MKNKPQRHKETNVFQFKTFDDRIAQIDLRQNALYKIRHINEETPEDTCTQFYLAGEKWKTDNLTEEYLVFQKKIGRIGITTLEQLLHQKQHVFDLLLKSLETGTALSLEPLLDLVVQLARDLGTHFYEEFPRFLDQLILLLKNKNPEILEWTFTCLASLFKTLKRFLKKDITIVFNSIMPLLDRRNHPEYVTNFVAESFAFVARDIKDKEQFLLLVLDSLKKHKNGVKGCGRLMFEMMKGVNGNLHSCGEAFLKVLLSALTSTIYNQSLLFEVLTECTLNLLYVTNPPNMLVFWRVVHSVLNDILTSKDVCNLYVAIKNLLTIMGQGVEFRHGKMLCEPNAMIESLLKLFNTDVDENTHLVGSQLVAALLLSPNIIITQLDASRIVKKVLCTNSRSVFEAFVWNIVKYSQFELLILPDFLRYVDANVNDVSVLELLVKIVLEKSPLCRNGIKRDTWTIYPLRFSNVTTLERFEHLISEANLDSPETLLMTLIVYPHILGINKDQIQAKSVNLVNELCARLVPTNTFVENKKHFFTLSILIETLIHLDAVDCLNSSQIINAILPFYQNQQYLPALSVLDLLLSAQSDAQLTYALFEQIHNSLADNLSSQYHEVRLLTAHILKYFDKLPQLNQQNEPITIYGIFFYVENITATVKTYRDQLMYLQKLTADMHLFDVIKDRVCALDPLRYLLGTLYINFKILWKPIANLIETYSMSMPQNEFWEIFKRRIEIVCENIRNNTLNEVLPSDGFETTNNSLLDLYCNSWEIVDRPDHLNYRILLWRMIPDFGSLAQVKNRDIVIMLMDFIQVEFRITTENDSKCWNVLQQQDNGDDQMEVDENETIAEEKEPQQHKGTQRTLIAMLSVFINMPNPKQIHRQPELNEFYVELLCHRNPHIQNVVLDCIMAYKEKYLIPYKDHLYGIIDEQKFKSAIIGFKLSGDENVVQPEHRENLMPILMRILYSKLVAKVQKGGGQIRKSLVMRFLGTCKQEETMILLKMAFDVYAPFLNEPNPQQMVKNISNSIQLESVLSPKKLQSSLNLIEIIREQFSGMMGNNFLKYLLNHYIIIGAITETVLAQSEKIHSGRGKLFRNLRVLCLQGLSNFFNHFDMYPWSQDEIAAVYNVFVAPILEKLPNDGVHSATPLLKLFSSFAKNPRFFVLLTIQPQTITENEDKTPMRYIIDLLLEPRAKPLVCLMIMEMIQNLLQLNDEQPDENGEQLAAPIRPENCRNIIRPTSLQYINFGSAILINYIPHILEKFKLNLKRRRGLTKRDLFIISRITELVTDSETSNSLLMVLMPILVKKSHSNAGEEALCQTVTTIKNLFEKIDNPEDHLRHIASMFEQITAVGPRKLLCDLIEKIWKRAGPERNDLKELTQIVRELNAWDRRWVEQPDYEKRLTAYKRIGELQAADKLDLNLGLVAVYHSFYFIKYDKDLAMRDSASYHLKSLVPALAKKFENNPKDLEFLIGNVILNLIRRTLNDQNENVRNEGILLLGELARKCPEAHPVLFDLHELTCKEDREIDFFDNITHLQAHRHGKALQRFSTVFKKLDRMPQSRTLTQFILPLATHYICSKKHADKHNVITDAIEAVGVVCKLLPWHQYESLLKFYLKKMRFNLEYQKQLVRVVMRILESFHFDLSNAKVAKQEFAETFLKQQQKLNEDLEKERIEEEMETSEKKAQNNTGEISEKDDEEVILGEDEANEEDFEFIESKAEEDDDDDENMEETEAKPQIVKDIKMAVYDKPTVLSHKAAKRLSHTIATGLIPSLHNAITVISTYENVHKSQKKKYSNERAEEEILKVPIALAMVKLLQKLPDGMLEQTLPGIFMKVCLFLKSHVTSVRRESREILKEIMLTVGTKYLGTILHNMTTILTRGFHSHVLTVTVYTILEALKEKLVSGDIDQNLESILSVCLGDIFGEKADEKEIGVIGKKTPEATTKTSYLTLNIVALNITPNCLLDLINPFREKLNYTNLRKVVTKVQDCLQQIVKGLENNKHILKDALLQLIYGILSESIPVLMPPVNRALTEKQKELQRRMPNDCMLIAKEPRRRSGAIKQTTKTNPMTNAHILIEFALEMLGTILKRGKLLKIEYEPHLNPFVPLLSKSLASNYIGVTTFSLQCLISLWNREMVLSKLEELSKEIVPQIFSILHKYATTDITSSDDLNLKLAKTAFTAMVALMKHATYYTFCPDQLSTLLEYVEQNLLDISKQTIPFALLHAVFDVVVDRKLSKELNNNVLDEKIHGIMKEIRDILILSPSDDTRKNARTIMIKYLIHYPMNRKGKKFDGFLEYFLAQLKYEVLDGRKSVIQLIHEVIQRLPNENVNQKSYDLFLKLREPLIYDESPECKESIAAILENIIRKTDAKKNNYIFDNLVLAELNNEDPRGSEKAASLCTRFMLAEKEKFEPRIEQALPQLLSSLSLTNNKGPGQFVRLQPVTTNTTNDDDDKMNDNQLRIKDHQLIQVTFTLLTLFENYLMKVANYPHHLSDIAYELQKLLAHEHDWVRLNAAKGLYLILTTVNYDLMQDILIHGKQHNRLTCMDYLYSNPTQELKSLCLDLCAQMIPEAIDSEMVDQVVKNLLLVANLIQMVSCEKQQNVEEKAEEEYEERAINLIWLNRRMRYVVHAEVAKAPHSVILRTAVFHWIEGITSLLPEVKIRMLAPHMLAPLVREMSEEDKNIDAKLRRLAIKVGKSIGNKIGEDIYNDLRTQIQSKLMIKRAKRKIESARIKVNEPVRAAMRKQGEQNRKKMAQKRKIDVFKGRALPKTKKIKRNHDDDLF